MIKKLFFLLLVFIFSLQAQEIESFVITHNLGDLKAKKAFFDNYPKSSSFETVLLKEVDLTLNKTRHLKSDLAHLDLETKNLVFSSLSHKVTLEEALPSTVPAFCLSAKKAAFSKRLDPTLNRLENKIVFQGSVELKIAQNFCIEADLAEYIPNQIILFADQKSCRFQESDKTILSKKVFFDLKKGSLFLEDVYGQIKNIPLKAEKVINLSSGKLTVLNQGKKILLQEGVKVSHSGGAELTCDFLELNYVEKKLSSIITSSNTRVFFKTPSPASFTSLGPITIDLLNKQIQTAEEGIIYKEKDTFIAAKKAYLTFKDIKNLSDIENITLEKEVYFFSSKIKNKNNLGLADRLYFDLNTKTLTLESFAPRKVLFWEEFSAMSLAADKIQIKRGSKDAIKGFGNVRFSLKKEEEKLFEEAVHKYLLEKN